jgi:hypothetical protein
MHSARTGFHVTAVHTSPNLVDLRLEGAEFAFEGIPWGVLTIAAKKTPEDVNQAAARIVREATKD